MATVTNSRSFIDNTATRTSCAYTTQERSTRTRMRLPMDGCSSAMNAMAKSRYGSDSCTSTTLMMTASTRPPTYPLTRPSAIPTAEAMSTAARPSSSDVRAPYMIRLSTSRPRGSVPSALLHPPPAHTGGCRAKTRS
jgi:hypothetical protein